MFGYIQANINDLTEEERLRYRAVYCGFCRMLQQRCGRAARLSLTYDLTFLILLLSSLYEPPEDHTNLRCIVHPMKHHPADSNCFTEYAADINVALVYHKCMDDWKDEHRADRRLYAKALENAYEKVRLRQPRAIQAIERELTALAAIEKENIPDADAAAAAFGRLMAALFIVRKDRWEPDLYQLGFGLGQFIYLADAAADYKKDKKKGAYNPLSALSADPAAMKPLLMQLLGSASEAFERLPLVSDVHLLRNIFYSGIWLRYNREREKYDR